VKYLLLILFYAFSNSLAQSLAHDVKILDRDDQDTITTSIRDVYFYSTIGIAELIGIGFGLQLNKDYALGIKFGGSWISGGFGYGGGLGLRLGRTLPHKIFNNINLELTPFVGSSVQNTNKYLIKGAAIEFNIGNEDKLSRINFIWSLGAILSIAKGTSPLFMPSLKIGFNINL
jgi:hypothetical protein